MRKTSKVCVFLIYCLSTSNFSFAAGKKSSALPYLEALHNQGKDRVIVRFESRIDPDLITKYEGKVIRKLKIINAVVCEINQSSIESLKQEENVKDVVSDVVISTPTPPKVPVDSIDEWKEKTDKIMPQGYDGNVPIYWNNLEAGVNSKAAWNNFDSNGNGIKIAIIDTGVRYNLPDFENNYLGGYDFIDNDDDPICPNNPGDPNYEYHGTEVASLVVAEGVSAAIGASYKADFYAVRIAALVSDAIAAVEWAMDPDGDPNTDDKADIINMSFGTYSDGGAVDDLEAACNAAYQADIILVAASGNEGYSYSGWPAGFGNVISVGAHAEDQTLWDESNGGVDIVAPGAKVVVMDPDSSLSWGWGTSYAAPHASALIALQAQYAKQQNVVVNNGYLWEVMKHSAHHLAGQTYDPVYQGEGKIYAAQTDINDANIGSIDLISSSWPIDYEFEFFDYAFIDNNVPVYQIGKDVNQSITLTNITDILGNTIETIEDLNVVATHLYYSQPNEPNLPGDSVKIFPAVSLLEPNDANSITLSYVYTIPPQTTPGLKKTTLELEFNFVGNNRLLQISYNEPNSFWYAAIPADLDLEDDIDLTDFSILAGMWQENDCAEPSWCDRADVDQSGDVGLSDVKILAENWLVGFE